jgi:hypothetical protein
LLLKALNKIDEQLKTAYSAIETVNLCWLKHFTWIYLGLIVTSFLLFLSQNLGLLPLEIDQVFGIIYGILGISVFYLNSQGIPHYTLWHVYPSIINNSMLPPEIELNKHEKKSSSNDSRLLNEEEKSKKWVFSLL